MERTRDDGFFVSDDQQRLDVERIHRWLSEECYWSLGRTFDQVERSMRCSIVVGCYEPGGEQVGLARWVSDEATFAWLCDVFIAETHRGLGLGEFMVKAAIEHPDVDGLGIRLLATRDAHGLYERFGFTETDPHRFMELRA
ncbi:MAG TPA: GNAT family N-acetyltransferase [Acidimicrobiales bacterium]|nr:GNAT family N-acetyltransferase [Acidimicrobiales bacterium]